MGIFRVWNVPITWLLDPLTEPLDMGSRLERRGWVRIDDWIGMAVDLPLSTEPRTPALTITEAQTYKEVQQWSEVTLGARTYASPLLRSDHDRVFTSLEFGGDAAWSPYLGACAGKAVANCGLFTTEGVAGIYWVSTLPDVRKRGFATELVRHALQDAAAQGYRRGILHSVQAAKSVYQGLGFVEHCRIRPYVWTPQ